MKKISDNSGIKNIVFLGLVSMFADISSEMVYPVIPLYLVAVFGATPALVGVIEGIAESLASLLKVYSGYITDRYSHRKHVAFIGYASGLIYKIALIFASSWAGILFARVIDRTGKGVRTSPRDALISASADRNSAGTAFGIHKALDKAGSAIGILLAYFIMTGSAAGYDYKMLFMLSMIPAAIALFVMAPVNEISSAAKPAPREKFWKKFRNLDSNLKLYLIVCFLFTLGNSSNAFLLLKAQNTGFSDTDVILLYFLYSASAALFSLPFGRLSDRIGRKKVLVAGYITFGAVYFSFAFSEAHIVIIMTFFVYGLFAAMTVGVERAFVSDIAPSELKGTMLGLQATVAGIALLPASVITGLIWTASGPAAAFSFGAVLSLAAAVILMLFLKTPEKE